MVRLAIGGLGSGGVDGWRDGGDVDGVSGIALGARGVFALHRMNDLPVTQVTVTTALESPGSRGHFLQHRQEIGAHPVR